MRYELLSLIESFNRERRQWTEEESDLLSSLMRYVPLDSERTAPAQTGSQFPSPCFASRRASTSDRSPNAESDG